MFGLLVVCLLIGLAVPAFVVYFVLKYVFDLRKRQNDEFLVQLRTVIKQAINETKDNK